MSQSITKLPPQNLEAELSILGGILIDNDAINKVLEVLDSSAFYRENNRKIFDAMIEINGKGEPVDIITLTDALKNAGCLSDVGGPAYVASLADGVATAANIAYYAVKMAVGEEIPRKEVKDKVKMIRFYDEYYI